MSGTTGSKLANLPAASTLDGSELVYLVQNGQDVRTTAAAMQGSGGSLPLSGGTLTGTLFQRINTAWSGGWSGIDPDVGATTPVGLQFLQQYTGTPTGTWVDPQGGQQLPINFIYLSESLNYDLPASYVDAFFVRHQFGGPGTTGSRNAVQIDLESVGPFSRDGFGQYSSCQFSVLAACNHTGSTALDPKANYYGFNMYVSALATSPYDGNPIHVAGLGGFEIDYTIASGGSVHSGVGMLVVNLSPPGTYETNNGTGLALIGGFGPTAGFRSSGIFFGNQQVGDTLPVISTGHLIGATSGTVANGIDFSATTFTNSFLKGPGGFRVDGSNGVHTDFIYEATPATGITFRNSNAAGLWGMGYTGTPVNYLFSLATPTGTAPIIQVATLVDANVFLSLRGGGTSGVTAGVSLESGTASRIAAFIGVASAISSLTVTQAASGNNVLVDVAGTPTGLSIGASVATAIQLGKTGVGVTMPGSATLGVASTTAGTLTIQGGTSGSVTVSVPAVAGSTTVVLTHEAKSQAQPSNPTAPATTASYKMQGLAGTITPTTSGTVQITISGTVISTTNTSGDGISWQLSYGTGAAPANAATLTGTQIGTIQSYKNPAAVTAANVAVPFSTQAVVTGLTLGTAYWIDLAAQSIATNSSGGLANVSVSVIELL